MKRIVLIPVLVLIVVLLGSACASESGNLAEDRVVNTAGDNTTAVTEADNEDPMPMAENPPVPEDFVLTFVETSRQCFGTAGCSVNGIPEADITYGVERTEGCTLTYVVNEASSTYSSSMTFGSDGAFEAFPLFVMTDIDVPITLTPTQVVC